MNTPQASNRLANETSPYLQQHAQNPVAWFPWGPEAIESAKQGDKPIFLSIGYSACHWCHVMEHESFEDDATARLLNENFISIKVDREERPDIDQIYMSAVMALTGHGGWPMSVFLTPDLQPFFAGTYFPPEDRHGMPSFKRLLQSLADAWLNRRDELTQSAGQITGHLREMAHVAPGEGVLEPQLIQHAVRVLERAFDPTHGGFGQAPKFPHPLELKLLLRAWRRFDNDEALHMVRHTLDRMAMGGMYDQLGGGFHRYSTDARWLVPHFEKMLYDNALLGQVYTEAFQATGDPFYREVVTDTLTWVEREMSSPDGPFFSTQDADSEGVEGKFFIWSHKEIEVALGKELAESFSYIYDVAPEGNWEGNNILNRSKSLAQNAKLLGIPEDQLRSMLADAKTKLLAVRSKRIWPGRDEKVLTAWNGLMIAAFAQAAQVFDPRWVIPATRAADFILTKMRSADGRLFRTWSANTQPKLNAYLEDYTFLIDALVSLYEATFELRWVVEALALTEVLIDQFWDAKDGGFFFVGKDHEPLIVRGKDPQDSSVPSGNSMAVTALLRLAKLTGRRDLEEKAVHTMQLFASLIRETPNAFGQMLVALDFHVGPVQEFAVLGPKEASAQVLKHIQSGFRPNKVVAWKGADGGSDSTVQLLAEKNARGGEVTTYICENFTCAEPLVGVEELRRRLG